MNRSDLFIVLSPFPRHTKNRMIYSCSRKKRFLPPPSRSLHRYYFSFRPSVGATGQLVERWRLPQGRFLFLCIFGWRALGRTTVNLLRWCSHEVAFLKYHRVYLGESTCLTEEVFCTLNSLYLNFLCSNGKFEWRRWTCKIQDTNEPIWIFHENLM